VGQNIGFDLTFLAQAGVKPPGPGLDTMELASILLPSQKSYALVELAKQLQTPLFKPHRAIVDAEMAMHVFNALRARLKLLEPGVVAAIGRIVSRTDWPMKFVFTDFLNDGQELPQSSESGLEGINLKDLA